MPNTDTPMKDGNGMNRYYVLPVSLATRRGTAYQVRDRQSGVVVYSSRVERHAVERCNAMNGRRRT